jgi:hypothetical protein
MLRDIIDEARELNGWQIAWGITIATVLLTVGYLMIVGLAAAEGL